MRSHLLVLLTGLALTAAACGTTDASESSAGIPGPTGPPATTTPAEDGLPRVLFTGDSLMEEVHAATAAALGGAAETRFLLSPRLIRDSTQELIWQNALDQFDPDVVVAMFSHWERLLVGAQTAADFDTIGVDVYARTLARPFADLVNGAGASLVWLAAPPLRDARITEVYDLMNEAYRTASTAAADARFVETAPALTTEDGAYTDVLTNEFGVVERVRNTDGVHLCPAGAAMVAEEVLQPLSELAGTAASPFWQDGPWRAAPPFDVPAECPPG